MYPADLYARAQIDQRLHFDNGILFSILKEIYWPFYFDGAYDINPKAIEHTYQAYDWLELFLVKDLYLVGDNLTVADLSNVTLVSQIALLVPIDSLKYPKVTEWVRRIELQSYYFESNTKYLEAFFVLIEGIRAHNREAVAN